MSKKLSGAENRKRRALKELNFEKQKKRMCLDKYLSPSINKEDCGEPDNHPPNCESSSSANTQIDLPSEDVTNGVESTTEDQLVPGVVTSRIPVADMDLDTGNASPADWSSHLDPSDPSTWPKHPNKAMIDHLVSIGPVKAAVSEYPRDANNRHFSGNYYFRKLRNNERVLRRWLIYSKSVNRVFCFCCFCFNHNTISSLSNKGYFDWQHISEALSEHENGSAHVKSYTCWIEAEYRLRNQKTIDDHQQKLIKKEAEHWNNVLQRLLDIILYLARNNSGMRGSSDKLMTENNGRYLGLIELLGKYDPVMKEHLDRVMKGDIKDHYCSKDIANELMSLMAKEINSQIISKIQNAKYFSIIADCTPDISHTEQLSITIRYVDLLDESVEVKESFLGFTPVSESTGEALSSTIVNALEKNNLSLLDCRGQGYDNGPNMSGTYKGVQNRILNVNPLAKFLPCGCHSLNLIICDAAKSSLKSTAFFSILFKIYNIFAVSTKRWDILCEHLELFTLKRFSDTRWESRVDSVKAVRFQIGNVHDALVTLSEKHNDTAYEALHLTQNLKDFNFLVSLVVWYKILFQINIVSKKMQGISSDISSVASLIESCHEFLKNYRENGFIDAVNEAKVLATELMVEPVFQVNRRVSRIKRQCTNESDNEQVLSAEKQFEVEFFNALLDTLLMSFNERFLQFHEHCKIWSFMYNIGKLDCKNDLLENCKNLEHYLTSKSVSEIDAVGLYHELNSLENFLKNDKISSPATVLNFIKKRNLEDLYPNTWISLRILLTTPVTVASGERSFSKLKLIMTYLRSTMTTEKLNDSAILSIEREIANNLDFKDIIQKFANKKARKIFL